MRKIILFLTLVSMVYSMGWQDVCSFGSSSHVCFIWPNNPAPYNSIATYFIDNSVCPEGKSCDIILVANNGVCDNFTSCSNSSASEQATFSLTATIPLLSSNVVIRGQRANVPATLSMDIDSGNDCTFFKVYAKSISFKNLNLFMSTRCSDFGSKQSLEDTGVKLRTRIPILFFRGGTVVLSGVSSNSKIATVLFIGHVAENDILNPTLDTITKTDSLTTSYKFPVIILNMDIQSLICLENTTMILYMGSQNNPNPVINGCGKNTFFNISQVYSGLDINMFTCPLVADVKIVKNCPSEKRASTHSILFGLLIGLGVIAAIILLFKVFESSSKSVHQGVKGHAQKRSS